MKHLPLTLACFAALALSSVSPPAAHAQQRGFKFEDSAGAHLDVLQDGRKLARYMYAYDPSSKQRLDETYKPFLHVFDADGKELITKGAGGSFPHHRGIFIGWNKLSVGGKNYDRWHMRGGEQVHRKFLAQEAGAQQAQFTSLVHWTAEGDKTLLEEERTLTFLPPPAPAYALIDMSSKLKAVDSEAKLDGDPEHAGLQFRAGSEIQPQETVYFFGKEKADPKKDRDYPWFGQSFTMRGKRYTVVYLNHPSNPKEAIVSAYRDYGRFGAFFRDTIPAGGERTVRTRFLIMEGEMPPAEFIQKAHNEYTGASLPPPQVTVIPVRKGAPAKPAGSASAAVIPAERAGAAPEFIRVNVEARPQAAAAETTPAPWKGVKRAGGGPENAEIKFKLPPPPVLTPQQAVERLKLPPGFRAELVAAEPLIEAPVAMSWDDQGRLYVVEMRGYMRDVDGAGEDQPLGRVSRLEDTNGDGVMDRSTIFADKLVMPRAVMAMGDGALIGEPPHLTYYRDTNGDGVADSKEVIGDNFGRRGGQPEHLANSPTWMMDNWIWCSNHNVRYRFHQGKFTSEQTSGSGQWGRTQDDWGRQFFNYNSDLLRSHLISPTFYARNPRLAERTGTNFQVMRDQVCWPSAPTPGVNRGYGGNLREDGSLKSVTAVCGATIYRGELFPQEFHGNAFIPEPSGNLVKRLILDEKDGVLTAKNAYQNAEFITSTDERFRPVNAYTGPDGALYIVDMARGVVQHKGFLTYYLVDNIKARDLEHPVDLGRIYRIVPEGAKPRPVKLPTESARLAPLLAHANGWIRDTAQRVLVERNDATAAAAIVHVANGAPTPQGRVHALWTLAGMEALRPEVISALLRDPEAKVRTAAVRLAPQTMAPELLKLVNDPSAEVRLQLAFSLSGLLGAEIEKALIALLQQGSGPMFGEAIASGLAGRELEFLELLLQAPPDADASLAKTNAIHTLAACVMKERRPPRVARLLELAAGQAPESPRQLALLTAMAGKAPAKTPAKGKTQSGNPLKLDAAPAALVVISSSATSKTRPLLSRIDEQLAWPGKANLAAAEVKPLTARQEALFEKGRELYTLVCGACHQPDGGGMAGLAPPLTNSEWTVGPVDRLVRIVLHGLTGPIEVAGVNWQLEMPGLPHLTDEEVAGVLTYIRRAWSDQASAVNVEDVARVRATVKNRTSPWSAKELTEAAVVKTN